VPTLMSDTIVVGTDGTDTARLAVSEAVRLAKAYAAPLHIVTANKGLRMANMVGAPEGAKKVYGSVPSELGQSIVSDAAETARLAGVTAETHVVEKDAADALLAVANLVGATVIVVGSQGMSGVRRLLGSVPNKVAHDARCNVLIVSTRKPE
jgi:nucleotide-binding universal stress UspA family protein